MINHKRRIKGKKLIIDAVDYKAIKDSEEFEVSVKLYGIMSMENIRELLVRPYEMDTDIRIVKASTIDSIHVLLTEAEGDVS